MVQIVGKIGIVVFDLNDVFVGQQFVVVAVVVDLYIFFVLIFDWQLYLEKYLWCDEVCDFVYCWIVVGGWFYVSCYYLCWCVFDG